MIPRHRRPDRTRPQVRIAGGHLQYRTAIAEARAARGVPHVALTKLRAGDVVDAFVDFHDGGYKRRPVIVISASKHAVVALRCTTNLNRNRFARITLVEWARAGLARPTAVDTYRPVCICRNDVLKRLGSLTELDIDRLDAGRAFNGNRQLPSRESVSHLAPTSQPVDNPIVAPRSKGS
jgi:hypothetical protein